MFKMFTSITASPCVGSGICPDMDPTCITAFPHEVSGICKFHNCKYQTVDNISELTVQYVEINNLTSIKKLKF